jgi:hypothetical protein
VSILSSPTLEASLELFDFHLLLRHMGDPVAAASLSIYGPDVAMLAATAVKVRRGFVL